MNSDLLQKQGAPHKGSSAAPACQCSVQMSTFLRMGPKPCVNNSSTKQNKTFSSAKNRETFDLLGGTCAWVCENVGDKLKCICNAETLSVNTVGASRVAWQQKV